MSTEGQAEPIPPSRVLVREQGLGLPSIKTLTLAIIGLGLLWRTARYAVAFPLWGDEAFLAVNFLTRGFAELTRPLEFRQVAPPGFLWAELAVVRGLGTSERALRLLPFLAGLASLGLYVRFCRQVTTRRTALLAVAILAASHLPVRHAAEVKPYAFDLLVALAVTSFGWSAWRRPERPGAWVGLLVASTLGVWCSYPAVFPIAGVTLVLLARGRADRSIAMMLRATSLAVVSAASWAFMYLGFARAQQGEVGWLAEYWSEGFPPLARPWRLPYWLLETHSSELVAYPLGGAHFTSAATALFVMLGVVALGRKAERRPLLALLLSPLPVALLAAALRRYPYGGSTRLVLYLAPAVCLLAAEGLVMALRWARGVRTGTVALTAALALIPIVGTVCDIAMPYRRSDDLEYRQFVRDLARRTAPGDRWIVFDGTQELPPGGWVMASMWVQRVAKLQYYVRSLAPVPTQWVHEADDPSLSGALAQSGTDPASTAGRTWLIVHDHGLRKIYPHVDRIEVEQAVAEQLGPPQSTHRPLPVGSIVHVHRFEPSLPVASSAPLDGAPTIRR